MRAPRHADDRPAVRTDADGNRQAARDWESLTERLIREAQEAGHFDDLPGAGRPLALDDDSYAGDMAVANVVLKNAGAAPPWIETDKRVRDLRAQVERRLDQARRASPATQARLRRELEALMADHDRAVAHLEAVAPSIRQHRPRIDRASVRARLEAAFAERARAR